LKLRKSERRINQRVVCSGTYSKRPEWWMRSATMVPISRPEVVAEKARKEKPLSISSMAISRPPKPKPAVAPSKGLYAIWTSSGRTWLTAQPATVHMERNKMRMNQSDILAELLLKGASPLGLRGRGGWVGGGMFWPADDPPKPVLIQVARSEREITGQDGKVIGNSVILEHRAGEAVARLHSREQVGQHGGGNHHVAHGHADLWRVGVDHVVGRDT